MTAPSNRVSTMCFASRQLVEPVVSFQFFEDELDLPACRVGVSDMLCVERVRVDVDEVEPVFIALGEPDGEKAQTAPSGAPDGAIHATLKRHLDFDVEDVSLQTPGHLPEGLAH